MKIIPGLTSTVPEAIPVFVDDLAQSGVREIALFPTVIDARARYPLYRSLERIRGLTIPHVHLRTDCDENEMVYLTERFSTEVFNIHPERSSHPFGDIPNAFADRVFVENVEQVPDHNDLEKAAGLCVDYSHLESRRLNGDQAYVAGLEGLMGRYPIGCCHISAIRQGDGNDWNGLFDHHRFANVEDLSYMRRYIDILPDRWVSLELENQLSEQLEAIEYLESVIATTARAT